MKKYLFIIISTVFALIGHGQSFSDNLYTVTFEDPTFLNHVIFSTKPNDKWQIGAPQKSLFTSAFSPTNVIVTDKINSYPINDTSVFIIKNVTDGMGFFYGHTAILQGKYYVNSDSLTDFGKIEFSPNNGTTWIDLLNSITYSTSILWFEKPTLTGNSYGWKDLYANIAAIGPLFGVQDGDTVLFKFSFISDNTQTNKDGLMYDDLHFEDWFSSIPEIQNDNLVSISPNPTSDFITISDIKNNSNPIIEIFNYSGQLIHLDKHFSGQTLNIKTFPNGLYFLKYTDEKSFAIKKIIVQH